MAWPYQVCIDRATLLTGVHAAGTTTWTVPFKDPTLNRIVLGPDFGALAGTIVTVTGANVSGGNTLVTATGNYSGGVAAIGRSYKSVIRIARPKLRDGRGFATNGVDLWLEEVFPVLQDSGLMTIRRSLAGVTDTEETIGNDTMLGLFNAEARLLINGPLADMSIFIESESARPFTLTSLEYFVQATNHDR